jgi:hypothetical protein
MANLKSECNCQSDGAELETQLAQLAAATAAERAPSAVRQRLLAEMRLQAVLPQPARPRPAFATALAGALSVMLLIGAMGAAASLLLGRSKLSPALSSAVHATLRSLGIGSAPAPSAAVPAAQGETAALPVLGIDTSAPALENDNSGTTPSADMFALPYSDPAIANGTETTVRVSVPASQLIAWGVPSSAKELDDEVAADLLLGDDGLPQAIRVLPASTTTEETYP